jgi:hypothetical protein
MASKQTTRVGYTNPYHQQVVRDTERWGTDNCQYVVEMKCLDCNFHHGTNGTNCHQCKCLNHHGHGPFCGKGRHEDLL